MNNQKLYFRDTYSTICHPLDYFNDIDDGEQIELYEAIPNNDKEFIWCSHFAEVGERNECTKANCNSYQSKSGRGVCQYRGKLHDFGDLITFKVLNNTLIQVTNGYIISLKWTHKDDQYLTLWRKNNKGYCWYKEWAQVYDQDQIQYNSEEQIFVSEQILQPLWKEIQIDHPICRENIEPNSYYILPNNQQVLQALSIKRSDLIKKHPS